MALIGITSNIPFQIFKSDKVLLLLSSCWKMTLIRRATRDYYTLYLKLWTLCNRSWNVFHGIWVAWITILPDHSTSFKTNQYTFWVIGKVSKRQDHLQLQVWLVQPYSYFNPSRNSHYDSPAKKRSDLVVSLSSLLKFLFTRLLPSRVGPFIYEVSIRDPPPGFL